MKNIFKLSINMKIFKNIFNKKICNFKNRNNYFKILIYNYNN